MEQGPYGLFDFTTYKFLNGLILVDYFKSNSATHWSLGMPMLIRCEIELEDASVVINRLGT